MLKEFKDFIANGSVMDMAVGIIIGAASTALVTSLVDDIISPIIGIFLGGVDFAQLAITVGSAQIMVGNFINAIINFLIIAFVVFMIVRSINKMRKKKEEEAPAGPSETDLLTEIRDALKGRN